MSQLKRQLSLCLAKNESTSVSCNFIGLLSNAVNLSNSKPHTCEIIFTCDFQHLRLTNAVIYKQRYLDCDWSISVRIPNTAKMCNNSAKICVIPIIFDVGKPGYKFSQQNKQTYMVGEI